MGVRYAPVRDYAEAAEDPGIWENGYLQRLPGDAGEEQAVVGTPIAMSGTPLTPGVRAPELGEHTESVLAEAGYSAAEIEQFREEGAV